MRVQRRESRCVLRGIQVWSQRLLQQHHLVCGQGLQHLPGLIHGPSAIGIHLQFDGHTLPLGSIRDGLSHRPQQAEVVVQAVGAAQLELHPRRRQLRPPAFETIQHGIH